MFEEPLRHPPGHTANHRQVADQGRQLRTEASLRLIGQRRPLGAAADWTLDLVRLIFDDVGLDRRQNRHDLLHLGRQNQRTRMAEVTLLSSGFALAAGPTAPRRSRLAETI